MVVLPAPFGPRYPNISPFSTLNVIPSSIVLPENSLCREDTSITARSPHLVFREGRGLPLIFPVFLIQIRRCS